MPSLPAELWCLILQHAGPLRLCSYVGVGVRRAAALRIEQWWARAQARVRVPFVVGTRVRARFAREWHTGILLQPHAGSSQWCVQLKGPNLRYVFLPHSRVRLYVLP